MGEGLKRMRYLSVCSGIEAASVAWEPLGWTPVGFSEIEPFPCRVLQHHYPNVKNYGDMTKYKEWDIDGDSVDLLVGGTPCQAFSVAGLRKGLEDPRGNLSLVFVGMVEHFKPEWVVWENVPGVLSSNGGRDFGSFIGALASIGYGFAWRCLSAEHFGVPQRRRRIFLVGHSSGDSRRAAEVLFEPESLSGNHNKSKATGEATTPPSICGTVSSKWHKGTGVPAGDECYNLVNMELYQSNQTDARLKHEPDTCQTVLARWGTGGNNTPLVNHRTSYAMRTANTTANGIGISSDIAYTLDRTQGQAVMHEDMVVRRLTPIECARLQGFPDHWTDIDTRTPDNPQYKAIGNSMAVPCMRYIGKRIQGVSNRM